MFCVKNTIVNETKKLGTSESKSSKKPVSIQNNQEPLSNKLLTMLMFLTNVPENENLRQQIINRIQHEKS